MDDKKMVLPVIHAPGDLKNKILLLLNGFERKELKESIPDDLNAFILSISDSTFRERLCYSDNFWEGQCLQESFLLKWEFDPEIFKNAKIQLHDVSQNIGLSLRYYFAWMAFCDFIAADGKLHKELLYESIDDLLCSITLAKEQHFKQSLQALRNFCEIVIGLLYFSLNENAFKEWFEDINNYHVPGFEKEMLASLFGHVNEDEADFFKRKYRELNHSVHSKRRRINYSFNRLREECDNYGEKHLYEWSTNIIETIRHAILLYVDCLLKE